jgi:hypothetical protein
MRPFTDAQQRKGDYTFITNVVERGSLQSQDQSIKPIVRSGQP